MAYLGRLRLSLPLQALGGHVPTVDTWLRLNPQWSVLAARPAAAPGAFELRLRQDDDDREEDVHAEAALLSGGYGWRLSLGRGDDARIIELELTAMEAASELVLRDTQAADDGPAHAQRSLWLRATADYMLLAASGHWRKRAVKWLLDRVWLRMPLTGRRVVVLILAYEVVGLAFLIGWLLWERIAA